MKHILDPKANRTCVHTYSSIMDIQYHMLLTGKTRRSCFTGRISTETQLTRNTAIIFYTPAHSNYKKRINAEKLSRQTKQVGLTGVKSISRMSPKRSKGKKKSILEEPPKKRKKKRMNRHVAHHTLSSSRKRLPWV